MHKLCRGTPALSTLVWLEGSTAAGVAHLRTLLRPSLMPVIFHHFPPPSSYSTPFRSQNLEASASSQPADGSHLLRQRSPAPLLLRGTWSRSFRAVEVLRDRKRGGGSSDGFDEERSRAEEEAEIVLAVEGGELKSKAAVMQAAAATSDGERIAERRQRGGGGVGLNGLPVGSVELLAIPGVGPRNLQKLVDKGFQEVSQLKQLYRNKFCGKSSKMMVEYLKSSVGIVHKNHAESITSFIKEIVDEELKRDSTDSDVKRAQKNRLTFCVEGNISVGKTTFLQRIANETIELRDIVEIVPEPISKWQDIGPNHFNILDAFYAEPHRYAYTFQNYVFVTRLMQERESAGGAKPLRLMERSVFTDRMVFVRAVHEAKWMNEMEISIYDSWFDPVVSSLPGLIPDGFIYLRASPDTCYKRMMLRNRSEEGGVSLDYLEGLHEKHESWLFPMEHVNHEVLSVSQLPLHMDSSLHPDIRGRVFFLEGDHMHPSIQKVPALVLDCEPNIDFSKDIEAKRQYARQVAEFFEFVKKKKEASSADGGKGENRKNQQILLPQNGALWIPKGSNLPDTSLKSPGFRRAISFSS